MIAFTKWRTIYECVQESGNPLENTQFFLFGARSTGKSTLLEQEFNHQSALWIDLLDPETEERLSSTPAQLKQLVATSKPGWVVLDEIQKVPELLNVVYSLSRSDGPRFALTGSSARKLKRGGANLLAGRAFNYVCHPLTHLELGERFSIDEALRYGTLPPIPGFDDGNKRDFLRAYVDTYFREEIVAEQIVRKMKPFRHFLQVAAQMNGKILNMNKIARDVGVDHVTVQNYFEVLEDTLVGFHLEPFHQSIRKRQRAASKFYYFDTGVTRALTRRLEVPLEPGTSAYGDAFEHWVILEIKRLCDYFQPDWRLSYVRTKDDAEIDLIIERPGMKTVAVEIKSSRRITDFDSKTRAFMKLVADLGPCESFVLSQDPWEQKQGDTWLVPWQGGIQMIGLSAAPHGTNAEIQKHPS